MEIRLQKNLAGIAVAICLSVLMSGCGSRNMDNSATEKKWKTQRIGRQEVRLHTDYPATICGRQDVEIRPQVSGLITEMRVTEGQRVRKGQTLFVIDKLPFEAEYRQAAAQVKVSQAALATASLNYESRQRLFNEKVVSEYELQMARNTLHSAEAELAVAEARELTARTNLDYAEVKSPADGVVGLLPYRQGALVGPDIAEPLTSVSDNSMVHVYFSMNENALLGFMRQYGSTDKMLANNDNAELILSDGSLYEPKGTIESISGIVDRRTGSVTFRAVFPNPKGLLHSGTTGNLRIPVVYSGVFVVPQSATVRLQDKVLVYKVVYGKAVSVMVDVMPIDDGKEYIVTNGLSEGDEVVADGAGLVRENMQVK